jgi:hypothetical protein
VKRIPDPGREPHTIDRRVVRKLRSRVQEQGQIPFDRFINPVAPSNIDCLSCEAKKAAEFPTPAARVLARKKRSLALACAAVTLFAAVQQEHNLIRWRLSAPRKFPINEIALGFVASKLGNVKDLNGPMVPISAHWSPFRVPMTRFAM